MRQLVETAGVRRLTDKSLIRREASEEEHHGNPSRAPSVNRIKGSNVNMIQRGEESLTSHTRRILQGSFGTVSKWQQSVVVRIKPEVRIK